MSFYQSPPQGGYSFQGGYPPQGHSPYPPQQGGYPPPQQGWGQQLPPPPQGGYSPYPPQQAGYQQPLPGQYPPQGPPPGQFAPPGHPPPGQGYGAPRGAPTPASPGYCNPSQIPHIDMSHTADELRKAMKGFGTNENVLIQTLAPLDAIQIENVKRAFRQRHNRDLYRDIKSETSGYFRDGLLAIVRGPLEQDCVVLRDAVEGLGTKESALNEVLLARTNADLNAIKQHYRHMFKDTVEEVVRKDLSMKTERLFDMVMAACRNEESSPAFPNEIERDVEALYFATEGKTGTDQMTVCQILSSRSNGQIRAIAHAYEHKYHRKLQAVIKKEFSGHMEEALLFMLNAAVDPAKHDADLLEESMKGMGTKDAALVRRIVMIHWDKARLHSCKQAYAAIYKQSLAKRIRGETRGDYEKLMVACIGER